MNMDKEYIVKVLGIRNVTHDVVSISVEKPDNYTYEEGQACELSINKIGLENKKRPFTFTSLIDSDYLEFTIKIYEDHLDGMTKELRNLRKGDELIISNSWGNIKFHGDGIFIAGGAGVTPFIAILRKLRKQNQLHGNTLLFSNKTRRDIILEEEFKEMIKEGLDVRFFITRENVDDKNYIFSRITSEYIKENFSDLKKIFYICGPIRMVGEIQHYLSNLGVDSESLIFES